MPTPRNAHAIVSVTIPWAVPSNTSPAASTTLEIASTPRPPCWSIARPTTGPRKADTRSAPEKIPTRLSGTGRGPHLWDRQGSRADNSSMPRPAFAPCRARSQRRSASSGLIPCATTEHRFQPRRASREHREHSPDSLVNLAAPDKERVEWGFARNSNNTPYDRDEPMVTR